MWNIRELIYSGFLLFILLVRRCYCQCYEEKKIYQHRFSESAYLPCVRGDRGGLLYLPSGIEAQDLLSIPGRRGGSLSGDRYHRRDPGEGV